MKTENLKIKVNLKCYNIGRYSFDILIKKLKKKKNEAHAQINCSQQGF